MPADADNLLFVRAASALTVARVDCLVPALGAAALVTVQLCDANARNCIASVATGTCLETNTPLSLGTTSAPAGAGCASMSAR